MATTTRSAEAALLSVLSEALRIIEDDHDGDDDDKGEATMLEVDRLVVFPPPQ